MDVEKRQFNWNIATVWTKLLSFIWEKHSFDGQNCCINLLIFHSDVCARSQWDSTRTKSPGNTNLKNHRWNKCWSDNDWIVDVIGAMDDFIILTEVSYSFSRHMLSFWLWLFIFHVHFISLTSYFNRIRIFFLIA